MPQDTLNEREFELVNIVGAKLASSQRDLSRHLDLSLGQTNMLVRRLVAKGYIRIQQLNKKKVEYILTPQGFAEKMRKSVKYTVKTINSIGLIKNHLREIVRKLQSDGYSNFYILGESDFALLVDMIIQEIFGSNYKNAFISDPSQVQDGAMLLICKEGFEEYQHQTNKQINLIRELAERPGWAHQPSIS